MHFLILHNIENLGSLDDLQTKSPTTISNSLLLIQILVFYAKSPIPFTGAKFLRQGCTATRAANPLSEPDRDTITENLENSGPGKDAQSRRTLRRSDHCTYLFPYTGVCVSEDLRGVTLTLTDAACPWPCLLRCVHGHNHNRNALASDELLLFLPQLCKSTWWWGRYHYSSSAGGTSHIYNLQSLSLVDGIPRTPVANEPLLLGFFSEDGFFHRCWKAKVARRFDCKKVDGTLRGSVTVIRWWCVAPGACHISRTIEALKSIQTFSSYTKRNVICYVVASWILLVCALIPLFEDVI